MDSSLEDHGIETLTHSKSGSTCQVHEIGATVLVFHPSPNKYCEVLFVSRDAVLNGSKAIRGGIPVVFPIFGPPTEEGSDMPQHGFARTNLWKLVSSKDEDSQATMIWRLDVKSDDATIESRGTKGLWAPSETAPACQLEYTICLTATSMTCTLTMNNTGSVTFPAQALFHTYYEVHNQAALDTTKCYVKGLEGYERIDKVDSTKNGMETDELVVLEGETDRVYNPPADKNKVDVTLTLEGPYKIQAEASGHVDNQEVPMSCVVWNPYQVKAKAMSDFGDDQYHEMICVEPGMLGQHTLEPGKTAVAQQIITVLD